jgi:hypothetical protein
VIVNLNVYAMSYPNLISTSISSEDMKKILDSIEKINSLLPDLISLSDDQVSNLPKVSSSTIDFVYETLELVDKYPNLVPDEIEIPEIRKDVELIESIKKILKPLKRLVRKLEDSAVLAGSEAYLPSMAIYNAVKTIGTGTRTEHESIISIKEKIQA